MRARIVVALALLMMSTGCSMREFMKPIVEKRKREILSTPVFSNDEMLKLKKEHVVEVTQTLDTIPSCVRKAWCQKVGEPNFEMAQPWEEFNAGCSGEDGVPRRRLCYAGRAEKPNRVFFMYQQGGVASQFHFLVFKVSGNHASFVGDAYGYHPNQEILLESTKEMSPSAYLLHLLRNARFEM